MHVKWFCAHDHVRKITCHKTVTAGLFQKVRACLGFFRKKPKNAKKFKAFENLGKNAQNLKMFRKRAGDCLRLSQTLNC